MEVRTLPVKLNDEDVALRADMLARECEERNRRSTDSDVRGAKKGDRCDKCCWKDRCDDMSHFYRPGCPYCDGTGYRTGFRCEPGAIPGRRLRRIYEIP